MKFNYTLTLERDGEKMTFNPEVEFSRDEDTYGNGFYMLVENCGLGYMNSFDCRYDRRLDPKKLNEYFPVFARDRWDGENGSAKLIEIEEVKSLNVGDVKKMDNPHGEDFTVKIVDLYTADGIEYAEVEPVDFEGFRREVPASRLKD